jgi:hypothetical protein
MPSGTFQYQTEAERLSIEAAIAFVTELQSLAQTAPSGQVLALCEGQALDQGRDLLRSTLQAAVQARIDTAEQKGAADVPAARAPALSASNAAAVNATC